MKIYFDTEFTGLHQFTTLVSIGLVAENGRTFYAEFTDYDKSSIDSWLQENVIDKLYLPKDQTGLITEGASVSIRGDKHLITNHLTQWLNSFDEQLEMWSDCLAYDWVIFCQLWGGAFGIPKCVYYIPFDLSTLLKIKGIDPDISREDFAETYQTLERRGAKHNAKHNALWDAKVIKSCCEILMHQHKSGSDL